MEQKSFNPLALVSGEIFIREVKEVKQSINGKTFLTVKAKISNSIYEQEKNLNLTLLVFNADYIRILQAYDKSKLISILGNYTLTKYKNFDELSQRNKENLNITITVLKLGEPILNQEHLNFNISGFIASEVSCDRLSDGVKQLDKYSFRLAIDDSQKNTHFLYVNYFANANEQQLNLAKGNYIWGKAKARGTFNESKKDGTLHYSISFEMNQLIFAEQKIKGSNNSAQVDDDWNNEIMEWLDTQTTPKVEQPKHSDLDFKSFNSLFGNK